MGGRLESTHLALALPGRLVRDFGTIVRVLVRAANHGRHHGAERRGVAAQLIRNQSARLLALAFQQLTEEPLRRAAIASRLDEDVDDVAVLVHGAPQILPPALNCDEEFVQIPGVAQPAPASPQGPRILRSERSTPAPNRLVGDRDTSLSQQIFRVAEAETEPVVQPDGVTDNFGRKSISVIPGRLVRHRPTLSPTASS